MKAMISIHKSFNESRVFSKEYEAGDFEEFLTKEGEYVDKLAKLTEEHAKEGEGFTVVYTVNLIK